MHVNPKDAAAGGLMVVLGAVFAFKAAADLSIGSLSRMGPGFFPLVLGAMLALLGLAIAVRSIGSADSPIGPIPWRGLVVISVTPIVAGLLLKGLGMLPTIALAAFALTQASRKGMPLGFALVLSIGLAVFCILLFGFGIKLPIPIIGAWPRP